MNIPDPTDEEIRIYQDWEENAAAFVNQTRYRDYAPTRAVFDIRRTDVPDRVSNISLKTDGSGNTILKYVDKRKMDKQVRYETPVDPAFVKRILDVIDGKRNVEQIAETVSGQAHHHSVYERTASIIENLLGDCILLPSVLEELNNEIQFHEIVRFPIRSPYSVPRAYWENQASVRRLIRDYSGGLETLEEFKDYLSRLHIVATMGLTRNNYYGGGGGIPTTPGEFRNYPIETSASPAIVEFVHTEITAMGFNYATQRDKTLISRRKVVLAYNVDSGRLHHHLWESGEEQDRKMEEMQESLVTAIDAANIGSLDVMLSSLAYFHWLFTHLHPFANINNSIAMNIVNHYLKETGIGSVPHLLLDYFSQRTGSDLYEHVFMHSLNRFMYSEMRDEEEWQSGIQAYHDEYMKFVE